MLNIIKIFDLLKYIDITTTQDLINIYGYYRIRIENFIKVTTLI